MQEQVKKTGAPELTAKVEAHAVEAPVIQETLSQIDSTLAATKLETKCQELIRLAKANLSDKARWMKGSLIEEQSACLVGGFKLIPGYRVLSEDAFVGPLYRKGWTADHLKFAPECLAAPYVRQAIAELFPTRGDWGNDPDRVVPHAFNDHGRTTHKDVMRVLDRAYELAAHNCA